MTTIPEITCQELQVRLAQSPRLRLLETLPREYFVKVHLPGAENLPLTGFDERVLALVPDKAAEIVTYCSGPTCANSHLAARRLLELGYQRVRAFTGGKSAWRDAGLPFESEEAVATSEHALSP